ncbi:M61 family metallopeptidase [Marinicella meishanensis]|uniref:M61 family metallopeptidase n=1 Tax=Marinicella meishanensis TaxID=2873263 RepID=UPI001CC18B09|nr:PDZ domain-containing protein [Marinicella sp. NBU2979]
MKTIWLIIGLLTFGSHATASSTATPINYQFTVTDARQHLGQVQITFPQVGTKTLLVQLPVWRSGRYEILNLSKHISQLTAEDAHGQAIEWDKTDKNSWKLWLKHPGAVTIKYQVYANMLRHRVAHIDDTHAFLDASGVFMFAPSLRDQPLTVQMHVPDGWVSRSGMATHGDAHTFYAHNYDQLVDSPIESGHHQFKAFTVGEQNYEIVIWGEGNHDIDDLQQQVTRLHHAGAALWGDFPYQRYVYMYHVGDGLRGATEHVNSTIIQQDRFNFQPRDKYLRVLATTAHEFVHTWNVKAYRPAGIAPYDYSQENYSDLFWMAEGITSYYDDLLLLRAGISEPKEYLKKLAEDVHKHLNNPGRSLESVAATSFDTWLKEDGQHNHNASVSIYLEGAMAAWHLDHEIRRLTDNTYGMDELQKRLYQQHRNIDQGYDKNDVLGLLQDITGTDMSAHWQRFIEGTEAIDFDALLAFYGLQRLVDEEDQASQGAWLGATFDTSHDQPRIKTVDRDSPAWQAGLTAGDTLLSINGIQVTSANLEQHLAHLQTEQPHEIHYFTAGRLQHQSIRPIQAPHPPFSIQAVDRPSRQQRAHFKAWTGHELADLAD